MGESWTDCLIKWTMVGMNNIKMLPALLAFAEVAKQESFTLAAKQLGMSKSAVSQQIKRL